jgi:hypothetical protein
MPNRSELKVRVMPPRATAAPAPDIDIWCVAAICIIGTLASIDFAAYLQTAASWSSLCGQSCILLMSP